MPSWQKKVKGNNIHMVKNIAVPLRQGSYGQLTCRPQWKFPLERATKTTTHVFTISSSPQTSSWSFQEAPSWDQCHFPPYQVPCRLLESNFSMSTMNLLMAALRLEGGRCGWSVYQVVVDDAQCQFFKLNGLFLLQAAFPDLITNARQYILGILCYCGWCRNVPRRRSLGSPQRQAWKTQMARRHKMAYYANGLCKPTPLQIYFCPCCISEHSKLS